MPNDVKAVLSLIALIAAAVLAYWPGSPIRPDYATVTFVTGVFMVASMWVLPEAGGKKGP
jgi:membrane protein YdbS with pleckstrin-like domain